MQPKLLFLKKKSTGTSDDHVYELSGRFRGSRDDQEGLNDGECPGRPRIGINGKIAADTDIFQQDES